MYNCTLNEVTWLAMIMRDLHIAEAEITMSVTDDPRTTVDHFLEPASLPAMPTPTASGGAPATTGSGSD